MSSKPAKTTPKPRGYKAGRTTHRRVLEKSNRPWHHELDDLLTEAIHRDEQNGEQNGVSVRAVARHPS
jgi:hypothetical protein